MTVLPTWRAERAPHQPDWPTGPDIVAVETELAGYPPLVAPRECDRLRDRLADVSLGRAMLLQGGDCAETFAKATPASVRGKLRCLREMAVILTCASGLGVVQVGRIAGQYAKPRSRPVETRDGVTLPSYLGDAVNDVEFTEDARRIDPYRLLRTYRSSADTLDEISALIGHDGIDLTSLHEQIREMAARGPRNERHQELIEKISVALRFLAGYAGADSDLRAPDFYSSHEALLLNYETALVRIDPRTGDDYGSSGHLLWIGERTRQPDGAHVAFAARVRNPVAVKLGPAVRPEEALALAERLDPDREPGRLTFIARLGADRVRDLLPPLVERVRDSGSPAIWICDPMHGNTITAPDGHKTRHFDDILREVQDFFAVHHELGTHAGGLHLELTGEDVTECVGSSGVGFDDLATRYESACDPRLNHDQSLHLALELAMVFEDRAAEDRRTACAVSRTS
ncbi:3-deoxy-7-phosphoheptulonate synthase class II [Amycolatopsis sp. cmx-11-51]|uniref:3-deoxy-7-phosphoheptulonate synthase class II n=1 Tax=Amycolatopsis sp. cmx-11-51 TaxID=2785797 RepID=UPI0039E3517E